MKIRDMERIRCLELYAIIASGLLADKGINISNIDMNLINDLCNYAYLVDFTTSFRTTKLANDYKEMNDIYNKIISNTTNFMKEFDLKNPAEVFTFYVYLYRGGFLSENGDFEYNMDLKDLPGLYGADIVRGKGVCRSISSMLVDIYKDLNYNSTNLAVCATEDSIKNQQQLCDFPKKKNVKHPELLKKLMPISEKLKMCNHQITFVEDNKNSYIFDPTNDGMLQYDKDTNTLYVGDKNNKMYPRTYGQCSCILLGNEKFSIVDLKSDNAISDEMFREIYINTLEMCRANLSYFKEFATKNRVLYKDLNELTEEQRGMMGRAFPFVPRNIGKTIKKIKK